MTYRLPLTNYRALEVGAMGAAGFAARLLGDAGAEVILVERPGTRADSDVFRQVNRNKLGCALDFSTEHGAELLRRLAARCDVVVEGLEASGRERLGFGYEALRTLRGDIVVVSVAGDDGVGGVVAGTAAAAAIFAALMHRRDTGEGQHVEVDPADCLRSFGGTSKGDARLPTRESALADARLRERGFFEPVSATSGVVEMPVLPWRFGLAPCHVRLPAPELGEHNRYVLGDLLGLSAAELAELERERVIGR
jgi:crotonobetainyl-CoA:carnitine CoA-transferase CaiB-like acyl-CoA transferase